MQCKKIESKFYTSAQNRNLFTRNSSSNVDGNVGAYKLSKITDNKKWSDIDKQDKANEIVNSNTNSSNSNVESQASSNSSNSNTDKETKSKDNKEIKNLVEKNAKEVKRINDELETLKLNDIKEKSKGKKGK
nr:hypothetical protein [Mycoplasmopsis bovis]